MATYTQSFASGYAADGTLLEDITDDFTRQYPTTAQNYMRYSEAAEAIDSNTNGALSATFSWDEPGETDGDLVLSTTFQNTVDEFALLFCWEPDPDKTDRGDCYALTVDGTAGNIYIKEVANGSPSTLASASGSSDGRTHDLELTYVQSDGTIEGRIWRNGTARPAVAQVTTTDRTLTTGKLGFYIDNATGTSSDIDIFEVSGSGIYSGTRVEAAAGSVTVSGLDVSVNNNTMVNPGAGAVVVSSQNPSVNARTTVNATLGSVLIAGLDYLVVGLGEVVISGLDPTVVGTQSQYTRLKFKFKDEDGAIKEYEIDRRPSIIEVATTFILPPTDAYAFVDATLDNQIAYVPTAVGKDGTKYSVSKTDSSANTVTVTPAGAETINGDATFELALQDETVTFVSIGSNWRVI